MTGLGGWSHGGVFAPVASGNLRRTMIALVAGGLFFIFGSALVAFFVVRLSRREREASATRDVRHSSREAD